MVGRWELTRAGIDLSALNGRRDDQAALFALFVAAFTMPIFIFPLVTPGAAVEGPLSAIVALGLAGWAVDTLVLGGKVARVISLLRASKVRVGYHEAGHLLVGYLLGVDVEGYEMMNVGGVWQGKEGFGVRFGGTDDRYTVAAVGLGGVAGEIVRFGSCEGGEEDYAMVGRGTGGDEGVIRWGLLAAVRLLREHEKAHEMACRAMMEGKGVEQVLGEVDKWVNREKLVGHESSSGGG